MKSFRCNDEAAFPGISTVLIWHKIIFAAKLPEYHQVTFESLEMRNFDPNLALEGVNLMRPNFHLGLFSCIAYV